MDLNKFLQTFKSLKDLKDQLVEALKNPIVWSLLICVGATWIVKTEWFRDRVREPQWSYAEEEKREILRPGINLQSCDVTMVPQIIVRFRSNVIYILNITSYYENNMAVLHKEGTTQECVWTLAEGQREKLERVKDDFKNTLEQKLSDSGYEGLKEQCEVKLVRLARVNYQRENKNQQGCSRLYIEANAVRVITEDALSERMVGEWLDLDLYRREVLNDSVGDCLEELLQKKQ